MSARLHCIQGCTRRNKHLPECAGPPCGGCEPRLADIGQLCVTSHGRLNDAINRAPDLITHIRAHVTPSPVRRDDHVRGTKTPPAPLALDALDYADKLYTELNGWHDTATDELELTPITRTGWKAANSGRDIIGLRMNGRGNQSPAIAQRLSTNVDRICQYEWAGEMTTALNRVVHTGSKRWPIEERPIYLPTPCPACDMLTLIRYAPQTFQGNSTITCKRVECGETIAEKLYDWHARKVLHEKEEEAREAAKVAA